MFPHRVASGNEIAERRSPALPSDLQADWDLAIRTEVNLLLEGSPSQIEASLAGLTRYFREPVCEFRAADGVCVPQPHDGTLILREVASLDAAQQTALLQWFDGFDGRASVRIVSTSSEPLFSFVAAGTFCPDLYYRLNVVLIRSEQGIP